MPVILETWGQQLVHECCSVVLNRKFAPVSYSPPCEFGGVDLSAKGIAGPLGWWVSISLSIRNPTKSWSRSLLRQRQRQHPKLNSSCHISSPLPQQRKLFFLGNFIPYLAYTTQHDRDQHPLEGDNERLNQTRVPSTSAGPDPRSSATTRRPLGSTTLETRWETHS